MKKLIASMAIAGMVLAGGGAAAVATTSPSTDTGSRPAAAHVRRAVARGALATAAETIGISRSDLRTQLRDGKTVAEVAQAHNVDPQKVVDALVAAGNARIDEAVTNGRIDAARAATLKQKLPDAASKLVNHEFKGGHMNARLLARRSAVRTAADTIGIDTKALAQEVRSGKTVAQVAQEHGVNPQQVIDAVVAKAKDRIDEAVANGKLTAERASVLTQRVTERVTKLVNETPHRGS